MADVQETWKKRKKSKMNEQRVENLEDFAQCQEKCWASQQPESTSSFRNDAAAAVRFEGVASLPPL